MRSWRAVDPEAAERLASERSAARHTGAGSVSFDRHNLHPSSRQDRKGHRLTNCAIIGLTMDRAVLYARINERVDAMIEEGLVEEVRRLLDRGVPPDAVSMQGLGL